MAKTAVKRRNRATKARKSKTSARGPRKRAVKKWSARVNQTSDAMDLKHHLFKQRDPAAIARSLKRSAERSHRRKARPFQSAMSMLNFYINRGGQNLSAAEKKKLSAAKVELRKAFGRQPA